MEVIAVVRTFGERTQDECVRRVRRQVSDVRVIRVEPFADAVRECFRIAIDADARWLVTVDADVLLDAGAIKGLLAQAGKCRGWQVVGRVRDKFAGAVRMAGVRAYRVSVLPSVLPYVPDAVRPEGTLARLFAGWEPSNAVLGRHDYEQWLRDCYRKGAQHRAKHPQWAATVELDWKRSPDADFRAAYAGWHGVPFDLPEKAPL